MIMTAVRAMHMAFLALEVGLELGAGRRAVIQLGRRKQEIDNLVLV